MPAPSTIVVLSLSTTILLARPRSVSRDVFEFDAKFLGDELAAGENGDVFEHRFAAIAKARGFDGDATQRAANLVDHESGQSFAFDVFGNNDERLARLGDLLKDRQEIFHIADFLFMNQQIGVFEHAFHALGIGDEVRRKIAAVELHAFDYIKRGFQPFGFFNGNYAFFADFIHSFGDDIANGRIIVRGDGADLGDFFGIFGRLWRGL